MKTEPKAPDPSFKRYTQKPFPPYRFIPSINPHPQRDPLGHSYGHEHAPLSYEPPETWSCQQPYLYGVDLYNYAFWWESHEAWEDMWHTTKKSEAHGQFLQGLIQISAAFIKWHLEQQVGLTKLFEIGLSRLEFVANESPHFMGVDLKAHIQKLKIHFDPVIKQEHHWPNLLEGYPFLVLE